MNLLKIDRRETRRITGERTYALATKDSNKQDEDRSENRDTLTQGIQRRYMKSREGDGKNLQSSNKKHKYQENNIPKKQTSESSKNKRSTLSDRAAIYTIDDDAQRERLTTVWPLPKHTKKQLRGITQRIKEQHNQEEKKKHL